MNKEDIEFTLNELSEKKIDLLYKVEEYLLGLGQTDNVNMTPLTQRLILLNGKISAYLQILSDLKNE